MAIKVLRTVSEVREWRDAVRRAGKIVGFVPTMGAIHEGHVSLARASAAATDVTIVSIFVNPTQFAPTDDLDSYPRTFDADIAALTPAGVAAVFAPTPSEMYPAGFGMFVVPEGADSLKGEGSARPGFFRGVCTVVAKLFGIVQPDKAFFGQKDGLQAIVVSKLVRDLNMPLEVTVCPTVREGDGLALSSRNVYLSKEQRERAPAIYKALKEGAAAWEDTCAAAATVSVNADGADKTECSNGAVKVQGVKDVVWSSLVRAGAGAEDWWKPEYVYVTDCLTGADCEDEAPAGRKVMVAVAVRVGTTRLIDNIVLDKLG